MTNENTILVISDHPEQFALAVSRLRDDGYHVRFETNPDKSLSIANTSYPRLIISELAVPDIDGLKLCFNIRNYKALGSTPILLVGDLSKESSIVSDSLRCGATEYLQKPFDDVKLFEVCRELASFEDRSVLISSDTPSAGKCSLANAMANDILRQAIFDSSPVALALFSRTGRFIEGNAALLAKLSNCQSELVDMSISELIFPSDDTADWSAIDEIFSGKRTSYKFENGYLDPAGERIWGRVALVMCLGGDCNPDFLMGVFCEPDAVGSLVDLNEVDPPLSVPYTTSTVLNFSDWKINQSLLSDN
ncbi:MAG: response regulator [Pyrinomonadaceae bacterium]